MVHYAYPLATFSALLSLTTVFYHFRTPSTIAVAAKAKQVLPSYWGDVDSDFDWCEYNNEYSIYLSEPFNTATSAWYPLCAIYAWKMHHRLSLSHWHKLMLLVTIIMGIGSMIFHGTLRYWAQLLDELPLYAMAVLAAAALRERSSRAAGVQPYVAAWAALIAVVLIFSERTSTLHVFFRGIMTVTFSIAFIYIFTTGSIAGDEIDDARGGTDGSSLAKATFVSFVVAIVSWILDIVACHELQALPFGLPYPQLHAFGWHGFTCLGLLQLFCLMLLHQHTVRDGLEASVRMVGGGMVPLVSATAHQP